MRRLTNELSIHLRRLTNELSIHLTRKQSYAYVIDSSLQQVYIIDLYPLYFHGTVMTGK
jgi:hypothetical protein